MDRIITDRKGQMLLLSVMVMGLFLDGLDGSIVNVALPEIARSFGADTSVVSWVVTIYFLVMAGMILIFGKIADRGAIKKVFMVGLAIFVIGSFICGISSSMEILLASRAIQGVGASMLAASAFMLCVKFLPLKIMAYGFSVGLLGSAVGAAIGPALGGVLTEFVSWHWIFFINVPVGIFGLFLAKKAIPADEKYDKAPFDYTGSVLLFISLMAGLYALESTPSHGVNTITVIAIISFLISFSLFVVYELRIKNPVLNLRLFKIKNFDAVIISFMLINAAYMGTLYLLPFYLNIELELDPINSGMYLLIPAMITLLICSYIGKLSDRTERRIFVIVGCLMMAIAMAVFSIMDRDAATLLMVFGLVCLGLVWGIAGGPVSSRIIDNVPEDEKGSGSSLISFFIYFGSALGTALFSGLFNLGASSKGQSISDLRPESFLQGFHFTMVVGIVIVLIALILATIVNEKKKDRNKGKEVD